MGKNVFSHIAPGGKKRSWIEILRVLCTLINKYLTHEKVSTWTVEWSRRRCHFRTHRLTHPPTDGWTDWRRTVEQYLPTFSESGEITIIHVIILGEKRDWIMYVNVHNHAQHETQSIPVLWCHRRTLAALPRYRYSDTMNLGSWFYLSFKGCGNQSKVTCPRQCLKGKN
jgi:hypothetical protein